MEDTVPHAGVLRAAGAAAELAIGIAAEGYPLTVKAAGEADDGTLWATFRRRDTKVTTCKVGRADLPETVRHLADFVRRP